jgi:putative transposase
MGASYSEDLRRCIIKASEQGKQSARELAKRFEVGKTFVNNLLNRYKETGNLTAKPHGGGEKPQLNGEDLDWLKAKVEEKNDSTLEELRQELKSIRGKEVSLSTICRALKKVGLKRKKKLFMPMSS